MERFDACLPHILLHEGNWSDDPVDPGGATMQGITIGVWTAWMGLPVDTPEHVASAKTALRAIAPEVRDDIYRRQYWDPLLAGQLPPGIDLAVFDFGVNSGIGRASKMLQRCIGCTADGHIGAVTLSAVYAADPIAVIQSICAERRRFLKAIPHFWRFGKGWLARVDSIEAAAIKMVHAQSAPETMPIMSLAALPPEEAPTETDARRSAKAPEPVATDSMTKSTTGIGAIIAGIGAMASVMREMNGLGGEFVSAAGTAKSLSLGGALPAALSSPFVWIGLAAFGAAVFIFAERRRRMIVN